VFSLFNIAATVAILSKDEQSAHAVAFQKTGDQRHIDALVRSNVRLAISIAKKHNRTTLDFDDLLAEAVTGILRAVETYDPEAGASFSSYAAQWMRAKVQEFVQNNTGQIRCGTRAAKKLFASLPRLRRTFGADIDAAGIARELGLDEDEVAELLPVLSASAISIDRPIGDEGGATIGDMLGDDSLTPDERMDRTHNSQAIMVALSEFAGTLNERHADIFRRRILADYMGEDKVDASSFGVTKQRVSQIEKAITAKLRKHLTATFGESLSDMMGA